MKLHSNRIFLFSFILLFAAACSNSEKKEPGTETTDSISSGSGASVPTPSAAAQEIVVDEKVECKESQKDNPETMTSESTKTCTWKDYKSVAIGFSDMQGRMSYSYDLYKKSGDKFSKIKNTELFNEKKEGLLKLLNDKFKADYDKFSSDGESRSCFEGVKFKPFGFKDIGITFADKGMDFSVQFGLDESCMAVDGTIITLSFKELNSYLVQ